MEGNMRRFVLLPLAVLCLIAWGTAIFLLTHSPQTRTIILPTLMVLPSVTPTSTTSSTLVPTGTPTAAPTATVPTSTPSPTPTLAEQLLVISAAMPGVFMAVPPTPFPPGTV